MQPVSACSGVMTCRTVPYILYRYSRVMMMMMMIHTVSVIGQADVPPGEVCFGHHRGVDSGPGHNNLISGAWNLERIARHTTRTWLAVNRNSGDPTGSLGSLGDVSSQARVVPVNILAVTPTALACGDHSIAWILPFRLFSIIRTTMRIDSVRTVLGPRPHHFSSKTSSRTRKIHLL